MYGQNDYPQPEPQYRQPQKNPSQTLAAGALVCAVLGILTSFVGIGFIFGGLAVMLALLSRGSDRLEPGTARASFFLGILGIVISLVILAVSAATIFSQYGSLENYYNSYMENYSDYLEQYLEPQTLEEL